MEEFSKIKKEIQEKQGREFIGMQISTEKQLESLMYYFDHPKLEETPDLAKELINLYYNAKESGFIKMEGIIRKLDQLRITLGGYKPIQKKGQLKTMMGAQHVKSEINTLKKRIEDLMQTSTWKSLLLSTQDAISGFLKYLGHKELQNRVQIFEEMLEKYNLTEAGNFERMQSFKDLLNKVEIKLGPIPTEPGEEHVVEQKKIEVKPPICKSCGNENRINAKFCDNCGLNFFLDEEEKKIVICEYCSNENRPNAKFCDNCGKNLLEDHRSFDEFFEKRQAKKEEFVVEEQPLKEEVPSIKEPSIQKEEPVIEEQSTKDEDGALEERNNEQEKY